MPIRNVGGRNLFYQINELFRFQRPSAAAKIHIKYIYKDKTKFDESVKKALRLFSEEGLNQLAYLGTKILIKRAVERSYDTGPFITDSGASGSDPLQLYMTEVRRTLEVTKTLSPGKIGFASTNLLNRITIEPIRRQGASSRERQDTGFSHDSSLAISGGGGGRGSPYNIVWMIAEFGTGKFAYPERRLPGDATDRGTKVPGGEGAWYFSRPGKAGPISMGQEGAHFLFGERKNIEAVRGDIDEVLKAIGLEIRRQLGIR